MFIETLNFTKNKNMKRLIYLLAIPAFIYACGSGEMNDEHSDMESTEHEMEEIVEEVEEEMPQKISSPRMQANGTIGDANITVDYGSPFVKGRTIWGDLVPYNEVWRAGANDATSITFEGDVLIGDTEITAGTYGLYIIPTETNWTVIINEEWSKEEHGVWGAYDYDEAKDITRIDVTPTFGDENVESMTFGVNENTVSFAWEKVSFEFGVSAKLAM